jgi:nitrogen fixation protein NifU and related proteins
MRGEGKASLSDRRSAIGEGLGGVDLSLNAERSTSNGEGAARDNRDHRIGHEGEQVVPLDARSEEVERTLVEEIGRDIGPVVLDHILRPRNAGVLDHPDGEATLTRTCGDGLCVQIRLRGDLVQDIRFMTNGCGAMVACGSMATDLARGKSLREAFAVEETTIMDALDGLPEEEAHCAALAASALKAALRDALVNRTESWKRPYRKGK